MSGLSRRGFLAGATAMLGSGLASAAPLDRVKANGVLRIAVYRDFEPWSWRDTSGKLVGIDVDLGETIARTLGVKAELVDFLADDDVAGDLRNMVWRGPLIGGSACDLMMHTPVDRQFALANDRAVIGAAYYREGFAMACGVDTDCEVPPPQFKGRRLAAELDSIPDFYLSGSFGGVLRGDVVHAPTGAAAMEQIKTGKADVALATRAQVEHAMATGASSVKLRHGPLPALPSPGWDIGIAVKDDSRDLADALDQMIAGFRADGTIDAILGRYHVTPRAPLSA